MFFQARRTYSRSTSAAPPTFQSGFTREITNSYSKDADFVELTMLRGFPPKVLWLRIGNCVTKDIETLIRVNQTAIEDMSNDPESGVLALFRKGSE